MPSSSLLSLAVLVANAAAVACIPRDPTCKTIPGDKAWPAAADWQKLNTTVGGRLIATQLAAEVCHVPGYDAAACSSLKAAWDQEVTHFTRPESFMAPLFQNGTCDPFQPKEQKCTLGNYVSYSINVRNAADVAAGIAFAQQKNVRLVIKNTGHDYSAKSTGKGALSLWTHNLKDISFPDYSSAYYTGKAVKMGAGVQGYEAYDAAKAAGLRVVGGECATVGLAGGFTMGGGHSSFGSVNGMAADQVLEWEVVLADGRQVVATRDKNADLYWALSGGGGGTFAVVLSMTSKAYPDAVFGGAGMTILSSGIDSDTFYKAVAAWEAFQLTIVDAGGVATWFIMPFGLLINPLGLPGKTKAQVDAFIAPFLSKLAALGITPDNGKMTLETTSFDSFHTHYWHYNGPYPYGSVSATQTTGGRLLPRSAFEPAGLPSLLEVTKKIAAVPGVTFGGFVGAPTLKAGNVTASTNAVLPAWRSSVMTMFIMGAWDWTATKEANLAVQKSIAEVVEPALKSISPGGGTYLNEANFANPEWKKDFYGANYAKLLAVKQKYDPKGTFYAVTAVGSEAWKQDGEGRLCRA